MSSVNDQILNSRTFPTVGGLAVPRPEDLISRKIPSSGELIPVIGLGTYGAFDQKPATASYPALSDVLQMLLEGGGKVIDSSPMYGRADDNVSIH